MEGARGACKDASNANGRIARQALRQLGAKRVAARAREKRGWELRPLPQLRQCLTRRGGYVFGASFHAEGGCARVWHPEKEMSFVAPRARGQRHCAGQARSGTRGTPRARRGLRSAHTEYDRHLHPTSKAQRVCSTAHAK